MGTRAQLVHPSAPLGFSLTRLVGLLLRDVVLTHEESDWFKENADAFWSQYASELRRNYRRRCT